jgi:hypothetical protein
MALSLSLDEFFSTSLLQDKIVGDAYPV